MSYRYVTLEIKDNLMIYIAVLLMIYLIYGCICVSANNRYLNAFSNDH